MVIARKRSVVTIAAIVPSLWGLLGASSCGGIAPTSSGATHPDPVVTVQLQNGSVLEFYDLQNRVMVSEFGVADHAPITPHYMTLVQSNRLVDLFSALRPELPIPSTLVALQAKYPPTPFTATEGSAWTQSKESTDALTINNSNSGMGSADGGVPSDPIPPQTGFNGVAGQSAPRSGGGKPTGVSPLTDCGNNCCDPNWTQYTLCYPNMSGAGYTWYLFDYYLSYANGEYSKYWGAACAAVGTSTFTINSSDGFGGTWSIPQGYYRWESDNPTCSGGGFCTAPSLTSTVNNQANQHEHTYCGGFWAPNG